MAFRFDRSFCIRPVTCSRISLSLLPVSPVPRFRPASMSLNCFIPYSELTQGRVVSGGDGGQRVEVLDHLGDRLPGCGPLSGPPAAMPATIR